VPAPLAHPVDVHLADVVVCDFDAPAICTSIVGGMPEVVYDKERPSDEEKMQERLP
jgi:hypothetical protein